jgi:hypothetical protein
VSQVRFTASLNRGRLTPFSPAPSFALFGNKKDC